ncbi:glycosyltransferase [Kordiimonas pumila]|uniref:Glycosyltransferase n=1 Tax=Kordiimonas pumila TaxID=2161677 RepID=A0ABV7D7H7_9PROT|nr:glycosyltransferase [Kordiimonas pumila]
MASYPNASVHISFCAFATSFMNVRVQHPIAAMRMLGASIALQEKKFAFIEGLPSDEPKVLILQRGFLTKDGWPKAVKQAIERDYLFIVEYDDYPENPFNAAKRANSLDWERFSMCHAVQCSTKPLYDAFTPHNPEVALFENHLFQMPAPITRTDTEIRVFFGALNRKDAWAPLIKSFNKVLAKYPQLRAVILHDEEFFAALNTKNKVFKPACDYNTYLKLLHSCDISLQPLDNSVFNRYKSDIKFVEAGAGGLAVVASPTVYADTIEDSITGLIAHTSKDWERALAKLAQDAEYRKTLGQNAKNYILSERLLIKHAHKRLDWYRDLWARRDALNARLFELYPQLKP